MNLNNESIVRRVRDAQRGQSLVMIMVLLVALLGTGALVIDMGALYGAYQELHSATQAAALAGGQALPSSTATDIARNYSAIPGNLNAHPNLLNVTMVSGYPQLKCLTSIGIDCSASSPNAIVVKQQATVRTYFAKVFGISTVTITATATASARGGGVSPFNVEIILDTTPSMNNPDRNCTVPGIWHPTKLDCAVYGVQVMLGQLAPCASSLSSCPAPTNGNVPAAVAVDEVGLMAFPGLRDATQTQYDYDCSSSSHPTIVPYSQTWPGTPVYQIVGFSSDYRASATSTTLVTTSNLVKAARAGATGCQQGIDAVSNPYMTFYADAIASAQTALVAEQNARKAQGVNSKNVIVLVSDGQANSPYAPPSERNNQCSEAVTAARNAAAAGTWVYSVAYGSTSSGCTTDGGAYASSCYTMQQIANSPGNYPDPNKFYSDHAGGGGCSSSAHSVTSLDQIFEGIARDLTVARLIPNNTT